MKPIVIDNCLPKLYFDNLVRRVTDWEKVPFHFVERTGYINGRSEVLDYSHVAAIFDRNTILSPLHDILYDSLLIMLDSFECKFERLIRIRLGFITAQKENFTHEPHVDFQFAHKTALLYLNNVDGYTTIYDQLFEHGEKPREWTIQQTVNPVANRAVLFDGYQYHSSSTPTTHPYRLVVNYNFK
jgi:hypothetical protein